MMGIIVTTTTRVTTRVITAKLREQLRLGAMRRMITMSAEERRQSASQAAVARWSRMTAEERKAWRAARDENARLKRGLNRVK